MVDRFGTVDGFLDLLSGEGPLLIGFSYTGCTTVCPLTNAVLAEAQDKLVAHGYTLVTLSIDPEGDTPEAMERAATVFGAGPAWLWLAASPADTPVLLGALDVLPGPPEEHIPQLLVGTLDGGFARVLGLPEVEALLDLSR